MSLRAVIEHPFAKQVELATAIRAAFDQDDKTRFAGWMRARHPGVRLWMSERTEMREGRDTGMDSVNTLVFA